MSKKEDHDNRRLREIRAALLPGLYRLKCDVPNPRPDRRRRDWEAGEIIEAGLTLAVTRRDKAGDLHRRIYTADDGREIDLVAEARKVDPHAYTELRIQPPGAGYALERLEITNRGSDRNVQIMEALAPYLEPIEETVGYVLRDTGMDGWRMVAVLNVLVDAGMITPAKLREAYELECARDAEEGDGE